MEATICDVDGGKINFRIVDEDNIRIYGDDNEVVSLIFKDRADLRRFVADLEAAVEATLPM